jgi:hypothetical protein
MATKGELNGASEGTVSGRVSDKELVEALKVEWKLMWSERFNDKTKAEGVSVSNYSSLHVDRGTIIHATRDFNAMNFQDILKEHRVMQADRYVEPSNREGGWNKFIKTKIVTLGVKRERAVSLGNVKSVGQQSKKGGRGWLHSV